MKILVTGSSGFLGGYLKEAIEGRGWEFIGFDLRRGQDILSQDAFYCLCAGENPDVVIHSAAVADLYESDKDPDKNFMINVQGTYHIARVCSILEIPLIYISTCCIYGNQSARDMTFEDTPPLPTEAYAWSKLAGEKALGCVHPLQGMILRVGTFYGPGMRGALFNHRAISAALSKKEIQVHGDGEQTRRYIHVQDVAQAIVAACAKNEDYAHLIQRNPLPIFNICGDEEISVKRTIDTIANILGKELLVSFVPEREGQIKRQMINNEKARVYLGWKPLISYEDGMKECIVYLAEAKKEADDRELARHAAQNEMLGE